MQPVTALLLADDRPGHFHLSEGILAAIGRRSSLTVRKAAIKRPPFLSPGMVWRLSRLLSPERLLTSLYSLDPTALHDVKLIVSAGGDTLAPNVACARLTNAPNIFYGSLRRYDPAQFALVLTSYEEAGRPPNSLMTLKPSSADPDTLAASGAPLHGLLLGGDAGTIHFQASDWARLRDFVEQRHRASGRRWIVSNSPRTPSAISDQWAQWARRPTDPIAEFIDVRRAGTGTLSRFFAQSETVLCTGDSSSMLSETVWMRRRVIAAFPETATLPELEAQYRGYLERQGWSRSLPIAELSVGKFASLLAEINPLAVNPLDRLAGQIAQRITL